MTVREEEMEKLEKELASSTSSRPFIEKPDPIDVSGLLCWLDKSRICGPDCVAFNLEQIDPETGVVHQGPHKCYFLLYSSQQAASSAAFVALGKKRIQSIEDQQRQGAVPPPPNPYPQSTTRGP